MGILNRASYLLPPKVRLTLYYSLIYPYLGYCNLIWASTYKSNLQRLTILQKRAVRFIAGTPYGSHTSKSFLEFKILTVEQIRIAQVGEFMYRYEHNLLPAVYHKLFLLTSEIHSYPTRSTKLYRQPFAHTNTRLFSIRFAGAKVWNNIPLWIRQLTALQIFKNKLRHYLIHLDI